jgi:hypothetical protein
MPHEFDISINEAGDLIPLNPKYNEIWADKLCSE